MSYSRLTFAFSIALTVILQFGCDTAPQREALFLARGKEHLQKNDYPRAVLDFRNAIKIAPSDDQAYYQLALAFVRERDLKDAAVALKKATELNPRNVVAQAKLAELMALAGDDDSARETATRMKDIVANLPANADALTALALSELRFGNVELGEQHLLATL